MIHSPVQEEVIGAREMNELRALVRRMPGLRLPSERDLSVQLGISRPRLRVFLAELRAEGLIVAKQGSGSLRRRSPIGGVAPDRPAGGFAPENLR